MRSACLIVTGSSSIARVAPIAAPQEVNMTL